MSDPTVDPGEPAEKRVRKARVAKPAAKDSLTIPPLEAASAAPPAAPAPAPAPAAPPPAAAPPSAPSPPPARQQAPAPAPATASHATHETPAPSAPSTGSNDGGDAGGNVQQHGQNRQHGQHGQNAQHNQNNQGGDQQGNRRDRFKNRRDRNRDRPRDQQGFPDDNGGGNGEGFIARPHPQVPEGFPQYSLGDLKRMPAHKLLEIADQLQISEGVARARKQDIIFGILKVLTRHGEGVAADGVLEILPDGFGFLRAAEASYLAGPDDVYISPSQIRRFNLRTGDHLAGRIRWPKDGERYFALAVVDTINGEPIEASKNKNLFENLTPLFPRKRFKLERGDGSSEDITGRILDLMAPQGKGQRALIVSPPKAGKTMMMQQIASAITYNHPEVHLIVLLIDERPEEVTEMQRTVRGEVISSIGCSSLRRIQIFCSSSGSISKSSRRVPDWLTPIAG